ncbi:hypothetical protein ACE1ET_20500 [Saccharicrinis sp. FJH62]|uniref:hypothetical protein n=1 Tax=Saccharicrinis sp. FJH62 TaxID=3344657 RepID=UPI0035D479F6
MMILSFELQFELFVGPILNVFILIAVLIFALIFALFNIAVNNYKKFYSYKPLLVLILGFFFSITLRSFDFSHQLNYIFQKNNLELIDKMTKESGVYELTDMLSYHKRINQYSVKSNGKFRSKDHLVNAFEKHSTFYELNLNDIYELRNLMEKTDIKELNRSDENILLIVNGFLDHEYGYIKSFNEEISSGNKIKSEHIIIARLIKLQNGWYFFYN